jgi:hypothetical protein
LQIEVGEWSTPSPPVIQVPSVIDVDTSSIYVSAPMDEVDSARPGPAAARVAVDAYPNPGSRPSSAWAYVLDVEEQNRTVEIEVELDDAVFAATLCRDVRGRRGVLDARERAAHAVGGAVERRQGPAARWTRSRSARCSGPQELGRHRDHVRLAEGDRVAVARSVEVKANAGDGQSVIRLERRARLSGRRHGGARARRRAPRAAGARRDRGRRSRSRRC